jgi:hypothetical protein
MTKQYKIVANGVTEIVEADLVDFMPQTGQTVYKINKEIVHIAPASALVTTIDKIQIQKYFEKVNSAICQYNIAVPSLINNDIGLSKLQPEEQKEILRNWDGLILKMQEQIQLVQLEFKAEYENH